MDGSIPRCELVRECLKGSSAKSAWEGAMAGFQFLLTFLLLSHSAMASQYKYPMWVIDATGFVEADVLRLSVGL